MFERVIRIYNSNRINSPLLTRKMLAEGFVISRITPSYQYSRKMMDTIDSGKQLRVNYKVLAFTAIICGITMDQLFKELY